MDLERLGKLEHEVSRIQKRNKKVEMDKAWETSFFRKAAVFALTYFVVAVFLYAAGIPDPWLNSIVPSTAFLLSTLTLPFVKKWWIKKYNFK